ncbi:hypothetical protein C8A05DRAFT_32305 [Staphylotrichum tortipilum]|uniref:Uncharacterized protein n=1 Tax=Staphylotrichum tortipilum TaxID=2831512 RepID=A0AAN6RVF4_9PEZI|nr:hypothetical protein C8A05DRAFT_32305 [Staphylotrichum longicolle]
MTPQECPATPSDPNPTPDIPFTFHTPSPSVYTDPYPDSDLDFYPDFPPIELDYLFHPDPDFLYGPAPPSTRYLRGRPATANPNPRGKHHRNPLPWSRRRLGPIADYQADADIYRRYLWEVEKKEQQQQQQQQAGNTPNKKNNTTTKKKTKPTTKPHFLTYLDAAARRKRVAGWYCCCSWCEFARIGSLQDWRREWPLLREEGRELARSGVGLPGEEVNVSGVGVEDVEKEGKGDVEEGGYGGAFGLEDIVREEPIYTVRYKKGRGRRGGGGSGGGGDGMGVVVEEAEVEQDGGRGQWEGEWDFVVVGDQEREENGLGSEWTGVDDSTVGDAWEALSDDQGWTIKFI